MAAALGIKEIQPGVNGELKVVYDLGSGKTATLAIHSDLQKRQVTGASVSRLLVLLYRNTDVCITNTCSYSTRTSP